MKIQVVQSAEADLELLLHLCKSLRIDVARDILQDVGQLQSHIEQSTEFHQLFASRLRRVQLPAVPYQRYYAISETTVTIVGFVPEKLATTRTHPLHFERLDESDQQEHQAMMEDDRNVNERRARLRSGQTSGLSWDGAMQTLFPHAEDETFSREDMQKLEELLQEAFAKRL